MPIIFGLAGFSGSGKTTLMCELLPRICARGLRVSTMKHAHHDFDVDQPGKDSFRHRAMGAQEVLISSGARWALMHENRDAPEPSLAELTQHMTAVDLLLIEGFKSENFPKIFLHREVFHPTLKAEDLKLFCDLVAIATDAPNAIDPAIDLPLLELSDPEKIIDFILTQPAQVS